ncbi:MAG: MFS transporter [Gemmatimonadaceae bacterium]
MTDITARPDAGSHSALHLPDFRSYLAGNIASTIGGQMQSVAIGWELYERTRSTLALGLVGLVQVLPIIALGLPAGHWVDRYDRRHILMLALAASAAASLALAAVSRAHGPILVIYAALLLSGVARTFSGAARGALLPQIVPAEHLARAVTWSSGGWQLAAVIGPALGGAVIGWTHSAAPAYLLAAAGALAWVALLARTESRPYVPTVGAMTLASLALGLRFVRRTNIILATITLDLFAVLLGGATTLLPVFARDILRVGPTGLGWLLAAQSLGAVAMAAVLARRPPMRRAGRALLWAVAGFGAATIAFGLSRSFALSMVALLAAGALDMISVIVRSTLVPLLTPNEMRGRVSAINGMFIGTSNELGGFESGALAALIGPVASVVAGGIGTVIVVIAVARIWPSLWQLGALHDVRPVEKVEMDAARPRP